MHTQRLNYRTMAVLALSATLLTGLVLVLSLLSTARAAEVVDGVISNEKISQDGLTEGFGINDGDVITENDYAIDSSGQYAIFSANPPGSPDTNELFSVELPNGEPVKLSPNAITDDGGVTIFKIAERTGEVDWVVFAAGETDESRLNLYSAPVDGSATAIQLNAGISDTNTPGSDGVFSPVPEERNGFEISPNGETVVFVQGRVEDGDPPLIGTSDGIYLYTVDIEGTTLPVEIFTPNSVDNAVLDVDLSDTQVAYVIDSDDSSNDPAELDIFSDDIGGGSEVTLNGTDPVTPSILSGILIDTVDDEVYFRGNFNSTETVSDTNLYRAVLGSAGVSKINNDLTDPLSTTVEADFKIDSDGNVVYRADATTDDEIYLYEEGSGRVDSANTGVTSFDIDGTIIYYVADENTSGEFQLYSTDEGLISSSGTHSNGNGPDVSDFKIDPDNGNYLVYRGDLDSDKVLEIYRVNADGTNQVKLNQAVSGGDTVGSYGISPDSNFVTYIVNRFSASDELYRVNPDGTERKKLSGTLVSGGDVQSFKISTATGNNWVIYNADQETNGTFELFISYDAPQLSITKTDRRTSIPRGSTIEYTIAYTNEVGAATATDVVITDTLPSGLDIGTLSFSSDPNVGAPTPDGDDYGWDLGDLAPGATGIITITADVETTATLGDIINEVEISTSLFDDPANNSDTDVTEIISDGPEVFNEEGNDAYSTAEDTTLQVTTAAAGVLENDTAPSGGSLEASLATAPSNGAVTLNTNGTFVYTPTADFNGTDSFVYTVTEIDTDGTTELGSANGTAEINVSAVNDPPTIDPLEDLAQLVIATDSPSQTIDLTGISSGPSNESGQTLSVTAAATDTEGLIDSIEVDYSSPDATGTVVFTPTAGLNGTTGIEVTVDDGQATNATTSTVRSILIRPSGFQFTSTPPTTATVDVEYRYDITVQTIGLASEPDLDINLTDDYGWLTLNHTTGDVNATLTGTPTADLAGQTFPITLTAEDGTFTDDQTYSITVEELDVVTPAETTLGVTLTSNPATTVATGATLTYDVAASNTGTVTDAVNITVTLTLPPAAAATYTAGSVSSTDAAWTFDDTDVATTGVITATRDTLAAESSASFSVPVTVVAESGTVDASVSAEAENSTNTPVTATSSVTVESAGPTDTTIYLPLLAR